MDATTPETPWPDGRLYKTESGAWRSFTWAWHITRVRSHRTITIRTVGAEFRLERFLHVLSLCSAFEKHVPLEQHLPRYGAALAVKLPHFTWSVEGKDGTAILHNVQGSVEAACKELEAAARGCSIHVLPQSLRNVERAFQWAEVVVGVCIALTECNGRPPWGAKWKGEEDAEG